MMPNMYPGLNPDSNETRILDMQTVDPAIFDDMVFRGRTTLRDPVVVSAEDGSSFAPNSSVLDRETGRYSVIGTYILSTELEGGHRSDVTTPARVEASDIHWLHAAWRRVRRQPRVVVMTFWRVPEEADNPLPY